MLGGLLGSLTRAQLNPFDENAPRANSEALISLMDKLNQQGKGILYFAGQGIQQSWLEMLSLATQHDCLMCLLRAP
ncbi:Error-prone, lesion bypass DNA polymerase V (UmuC) [Cronobacter malonaticus 681]|nr:hypothetical protein AFK66_021830 [Cronobacter malonaticus LMG 23826]CCJ93154.1 Error-prone, lesion bypass DNA polymerase V (UmuC) [Cronobacter malonaticus 681]